MMCGHGLLFVAYLAVAGIFFGLVLSYDHRSPSSDDNVYDHILDDDGSDTFPQQVHAFFVGDNQVRISWITKGTAPPTVDYGLTPDPYTYTNWSIGTTKPYKSVLLHEVAIGSLRASTVYYYICSKNHVREYSFETPPSAAVNTQLAVTQFG